MQWANLTVEDIDIFAFSSLDNPDGMNAQEIKKQYGESKWKKYCIDFFKSSPLFGIYKSIKANQRKKFLINAGIPKNKSDALDTFRKSDLQILVMDNFIVTKNS